ncbi:hypothetical protein O3M35_011390 [Rhynocoris fuscipes]|uniref:Poly(A) RNA polymerase, mitochondrial n=1 Tax=Rhynocoris fuscipes TaxID=488301 RepID=A0AAW1D2T9_9HEMI
MSFYNHFYEILVKLSHSNYCFHSLKRTKFNLKHRKLYINFQRQASSDVKSENVEKKSNDKFLSFEKMVEYRRNEARRSIGVQVQSEGSGKELYHYCKSIAPISSMFYYKVKNNHYFLVEFCEDCSPLLSKAIYPSGSGVIPAKSPFLWFKASKRSGKSTLRDGTIFDDLPFKDSSVPSQQEVFEWIEQTCSLSDSMKVLYEGTRLDELGTRLRLLTARQIEMAMEGIFPNIGVLPFGSSVNGLGKAGCDLDLVVHQHYSIEDHEKNTFRLVQHHKTTSSSSRQYIQRQMEVLADIIQLYLPGCYSVKRILQARVPIVKFSQEVTGVDCDLSMTNMTGVYMSELLYLMGCLDEFARPLVFTVKQWAWATGLTNPVPGRWITNFTLTLLTLFYLQVINRLPSVDKLKAAAGPQDKRVTEDIDCTFIRDLTRFKWKLPKNDDKNELSSLLKGFFDYYTTFDFSSAGISLNEGKTIPKPDFSPLYVVNPLEKNANVSKNVSLEEVERLRIAVRDAAWNFENTEDQHKLFRILITRSPSVNESSKKFIPNNKIFSVKTLFTNR